MTRILGNHVIHVPKQLNIFLGTFLGRFYQEILTVHQSNHSEVQSDASAGIQKTDSLKEINKIVSKEFSYNFENDEERNSGHVKHTGCF